MCLISAIECTIAISGCVEFVNGYATSHLHSTQIASFSVSIHRHSIRWHDAKYLCKIGKICWHTRAIFCTQKQIERTISCRHRICKVQIKNEKNCALNACSIKIIIKGKCLVGRRNRLLFNE